MLTRCPRCSTTFRVTPEQLKARHGRVRCGHCNDVFDALDTLIEAPPQPVAVVAQQAEETAEHSIPVFAQDAEPEIASPPDEAPSIEPQQDPEADAGEDEPAEAFIAGEPEPPAAPAASADLRESVATAEAEDAGPAQPALEPLLHELSGATRRWPWAVGSAAAVAAFLLQAVIHYRTEISVLYPGAKPLLNAACAPFGCGVSLPRKPELVGIEASSLAPESGSKLALSATLKNRAPFAQQYPDLELTLSDTADKPLVRRVLKPAEYLPPKTDVAAGFGAGSEIAIALSVDAPGLPAAGYQLYLFYP